MFSGVTCTQCGRAYPVVGLPYLCPDCGGIFDYSEYWNYTASGIDLARPGIWKWTGVFGLDSSLPVVSLSEGNTPLVWMEIFGRRVAFKCEFLNPSGSFKDRGSATLVSALTVRAVTEAIEDSSGNAGASFAAYAARAGIRARVYVPGSVSGPKRMQIEAYGAELVPIPGPRSAAADAVQLAARQGAVYASHACLPFNLPGYATLAVELASALGAAPGAVILPAGQGGLLLGAGRGFQAMQASGAIKTVPQMVGVQARACAPLWSLAQDGTVDVDELPTLAEGVRVRSPQRAEAIVRLMQATGGRFLAVDEAHILPGRDELARRGLYVEPTSALVWRALQEALPELPDPVVVVLTGSGLKTTTA